LPGVCPRLAAPGLCPPARPKPQVSVPAMPDRSPARATVAKPLSNETVPALLLGTDTWAFWQTPLPSLGTDTVGLPPPPSRRARWGQTPARGRVSVPKCLRAGVCPRMGTHTLRRGPKTSKCLSLTRDRHFALGRCRLRPTKKPPASRGLFVPCRLCKPCKDCVTLP